MAEILTSPPFEKENITPPEASSTDGFVAPTPPPPLVESSLLKSPAPQAVVRETSSLSTVVTEPAPDLMALINDRATHPADLERALSVEEQT